MRGKPMNSPAPVLPSSDGVLPQPVPGGSALGGAAGGLSYEGACRDAVALEEQLRRAEAAGRGHVARSAPAVARQPVLETAG